MSTQSTSRRSPSTSASLRGPSRRGFALPSAIFALVVVALLVTAGFYMARQESRIGVATDRTTEARILAESGLNEVAATWRPSLSPVLDMGESVQVASQARGNGEWRVQVTRVDDVMYLVESTGEVTQGGRLAGASRTLFQMLRSQPLNLSAPEAALTTQGSVTVGGNARVDGNNSNGDPNWSLASACPGGADPNLSRPGIVLDENPGSGAFQNNGDPVVEGSVLGGTGPSAVQVAGQPQGVLKDQDLVDETFAIFDDVDSWNALVAMANVRIARAGFERVGYEILGNQNIPDPAPTLNAAGECNTASWQNWGSLTNNSHPCSNYRPVIHIVGPMSGNQVFKLNGGQGQGILLVDGSIEITGNFRWAGLILVNGTLDTQGTAGGPGGLQNELLGAVVSRNSLLDTQSTTGTSLIRYSACAVETAIQGARGNLPLRPLSSRSWIDATAAGF